LVSLAAGHAAAHASETLKSQVKAAMEAVVASDDSVFKAPSCWSATARRAPEPA
jgi:hypothetical protein